MGPLKKYVIVKIPIFDPSSPPCHRLSPFALTPLPPCHHPNSDKLFDPKLGEQSVSVSNLTHTNAKVTHRMATEKQN